METIRNDEKDTSGSAEVSDETAIRAVFDAALEFLRLVGSDVFDSEREVPNKQLSQPTCHLTAARIKPDSEREVPNKLTAARMKPAAGKSSPVQKLGKEQVTKAQRRKLERIKAPVTVFRKPPVDTGLTEREQADSVNRTLKYLGQMPRQEEFQPPLIPMVVLNTGADQNMPSVEQSENSEDSSREASVTEHEYLSSDRDINLWKLLLSSPTNCNVFVGNLSHQVTGEMLMAAFGTFCQSQESELKTHVVMDASKSQSRGYGFVNFPQRRAAEVAVICMQDFELCGRSLQLGWGQEKREDGHVPTGKVASKSNTGCVVSDKVYSQDGSLLDFPKRQTLKRKGSRWDQHAQEKICRKDPQSCNEESCDEPVDFGENKLSATGSETEEDGVHLERRSPREHSEQDIVETGSILDTVKGKSKMDTEKLRTGNSVTVQYGFWELEQGFKSSAGVDGPPRAEENCTVTTGIYDEAGVGLRQNVSGLTERTDGQENASGSETNQIKENNEEVCKSKTTSADTVQSQEEAPIKSSTPRKVIHWLTHRQKVSLLKSACCRLRDAGVWGHLGVFGIHYEADNSRLYVVCAKHLTETELCHEFTRFGSMEVKLNVDVTGNSKGCAFVQYSNSRDAETAMKQLHGKVVGGCPLKVLIAEPKTRKTSQRNRNQKSYILEQ